MALNKFMHPRNKYKNRKPDFSKLAEKYPEFRTLVTKETSGKITLDFKDPACLRGLTRTLLLDDFGLDVELPLDRLIPTVPQRLNYVHWIEDLVGQNISTRGIDIGTGASCIYPLLGCKLNNWSFLATEVDDVNLHFTKKNIEKNSMQDRIQIKQVTEGSMLLDVVEEDQKYGFCMCNPPFFTDNLEAQGILNTRNDDRAEPHSVSTASEVESIAWGGEVAFVTKMIEDSIVLRERIRVYTSLIGKKVNLALLKDELKRRQVPYFSSTEFCQGKTMRWGLAWTFDSSVKFQKSAFQQQKLVRKPVILEVSSDWLDLEYTVPALTIHVKAMLDDLKIHYKEKATNRFLTSLALKAVENTWSHQRRKRRRQRRESASEQMSAPSNRGDNSDAAKEKDANSNKIENLLEAEDRNKLEGIESDLGNDSGSDQNADDKQKIPDDSGRALSKENRSVKRKSDSDDPCGIPHKRQNPVDTTEEEAHSKKAPDIPACESSSCLVVCDLILKKTDGKISLELVFEDGSRECMHQIMQYFKNQFISAKK